MTIVIAPDVPVLLPEVNVALMVWVPARNPFEIDATPFWSVAPPPMGTPPSRNVTLAPATPAPPAVTVAVKVMGAPSTAVWAELLKLMENPWPLAGGMRQQRSKKRAVNPTRTNFLQAGEW